MLHYSDTKTFLYLTYVAKVFKGPKILRQYKEKFSDVCVGERNPEEPEKKKKKKKENR